jgi:polyribonucleotide 5'-hydroxyl-kinase
VLHTYIPVIQVAELDVPYRQRVHAQQIHTYMYGQVITPPRGLSVSIIGDADFDGHLAPSSSVIPFGELSFLRIGESEPFYLLPSPSWRASLTCFVNSESMAPSSALPIGATRTVNEMHPMQLDPASSGSGLLNAIVALLAPPVHPEETERYDEEVLDLQVSGFLAMFVLKQLLTLAVLTENLEPISIYRIGS